MKRQIVIAAMKAIKNKRVYDWVCTYVRHSGFVEPTNMLNTLPEDLPPKIKIYFETNEGFGLLYSKDGAKALLDQVIKPFGVLDNAGYDG
jgi:hypothetical protein